MNKTQMFLLAAIVAIGFGCTGEEAIKALSGTGGTTTVGTGGSTPDGTGGSTPVADAGTDTNVDTTAAGGGGQGGAGGSSTATGGIGGTAGAGGAGGAGGMTSASGGATASGGVSGTGGTRSIVCTDLVCMCGTSQSHASACTVSSDGALIVTACSCSVGTGTGGSGTGGVGTGGTSTGGSGTGGSSPASGGTSGTGGAGTGGTGTGGATASGGASGTGGSSTGGSGTGGSATGGAGTGGSAGAGGAGGNGSGTTGSIAARVECTANGNFITVTLTGLGAGLNVALFGLSSGDVPTRVCLAGDHNNWSTEASCISGWFPLGTYTFNGVPIGVRANVVGVTPNGLRWLDVDGTPLAEVVGRCQRIQDTQNPNSWAFQTTAPTS